VIDQRYRRSLFLAFEFVPITTVRHYTLSMEATRKCIRCDVEMEEGFIADHGHGAIFVATWVKGKPEPSFWTKTKISDREKHLVRTFRCPHCGALESFA
jgi:hypothetical protein